MTAQAKDISAVILAGGRGERLGALSRDLPKPLLPIGDRPVLGHQLDYLLEQGLRRIFILCRHLAGSIQEYLARRQPALPADAQIEVVVEKAPLGTAGALRQLAGRVDGDLLVVYGDVFFDMLLDDLFLIHRQNKAAVTLVAHPTDHPQDSDLLQVDRENDRVVSLLPKGMPRSDAAPLGNTGIFMLAAGVLKQFPDTDPSDFAGDVLPLLLKRRLPVFVYRSAEYIRDMGTPARLERVRSDYLAGRTRALSRKNLRPAVFFDRDGTLVRKVHLLHRPEELFLAADAAAAVAAVNRAGLLAVLVTNQPVVARNLCDMDTLNRIHDRLEWLLAAEGAWLDRVFFCPHHPDAGYAGENPVYKIPCRCRKPSTGMIDQAAAILAVDRARSWMVGDSAVDVMTGKNAGLGTALVGDIGADAALAAGPRPDIVAPAVLEAVRRILQEKP